MMKKFSKIMIVLSLVLTIGTGFVFNTAFANGDQAASKAATTTLKEQQFEVTKYLNLGTTGAGEDAKTQQGQSYFKATGVSPTVAFIVKLIELAVKIAGTLAVTLMIITGLAMIFSQGNQNMVEKAKQMFKYEIIGIIVIFVSYVVVTFVQSIFITT